MSDQFLTGLCIMSLALWGISTIGLALIDAFKRVDPEIPQVDVPAWDRKTLTRNTSTESETADAQRN